MYSYLIQIDDPEGGYTCKLLHKNSFTQEQFIDMVNTSIAKYMADNLYSVISDYAMSTSITEYLVSYYKFVRPTRSKPQAVWRIGWFGVDLGCEHDEYRSDEDMTILTDIRNKVNERIRT